MPGAVQVKDYVDPLAGIESTYRKPKTCTHCSRPATKELLFKKPGITVIEKYCDSCVELALQNRIGVVKSAGPHSITVSFG